MGVAGSIGLALMTPGCSARSLPLREGRFPDLMDQNEPFLGLATSFTAEVDYEPLVEGRIPRNLRGTLFRNTGALFERGGHRKRSMLDGDGMVQSFRFIDESIRFRNRFVRTDRFREESRAGTLLYPTFSTQAPGGVLANLWAGARMRSQAQISVVVRNGRLFTFEESSLPYELDSVTLETKGVSSLGLPEEMTLYNAHSKIDPKSGEWILFGLHYGRKVTLHITIFQRDGRLRSHRTMPLPRYVHVHDFFATEGHLVFSLHPLEIRVFDFLFGLSSLADSLRWKPEEGNLLMVVPRENGGRPLFIETSSCFMWHSVNAYEDSGAIIADFVGYPTPDHFIGPDPPIFAAMEGRRGRFSSFGEFRRYRIDLPTKTAIQETLHKGSFEWPMVNPFHQCHPYRFSYLARTQGDDFFWSGITRFDLMTGKVDNYFFEEGMYCGEPVFAPNPGFPYSSLSKDEPGWLLTEVYNGRTKRSFLAVLRADRVQDGPIALIHLRHHMPFSMHGFWQGEQ